MDSVYSLLTMSTLKSDCRKFQPNIFNKIKCSNCFRQREEHSLEALESNRASRKVSKCGYLFVAPDWDFSNPLNRTKRWQRRWFVLFDDGELTYSLDDLPATIPQGTIDMNRVLEVSDAEDVTGNRFALAITSPDRATFVKGTCREESRWWRDVLSVFPRTQKQHGRYKRNATFPGIKSSSSSVLQQSRAALARTPSPSLAPSFDSSPSQRVRFHSCATDSLSIGRPSSAPTLGGQEDVFPTRDTSLLQVDCEPPPSPPIFHSTPMTSLPPSTFLSDEHKENTPPPYIEDYQDNPPTSESPPTQDKVFGHRPKTRRTAKREARGLAHHRSDFSHQHILSNLEETKREEKLKDIAESLTRPRSKVSCHSILSKENEVTPTRESDSQEQTPSKSLNAHCEDITDSSLSGQIRGDPDGCGLEGDLTHYTPTTDTQRVDLPAEDVLHIKKGWLLKQGFSQLEWSKHWFVLEGSGLKFYRDPSAEDNGILDGIIDLVLVKDIQEKEVGRNYGFIVTTWDDKKLVFSGVTSGIRCNWIQAMRNAANLKEQLNRPLTLGERLEREIGANPGFIQSVDAEPDADHPSAPSNVRANMSSDESFKSASESFHDDIANENLSNYDRVTARSNTRAAPSCQRSRSSPPTSRRGTRDDFPQNISSASKNYMSEAESVASMQDLERHLTPERDCSGTSSGEGMLVDLLETQVESLKAKLEQTQGNYLELHKENVTLKDRLAVMTPSLTTKCTDRGDRYVPDLCLDRSQISDLKTKLLKQESEITEKNKIISKIEVIRRQLQEEKHSWENRLLVEENKVKELKASESKHKEIVRSLKRSLQEAEMKVNSLTQELSKANTSSGLTNSQIKRVEQSEATLRAENTQLKKQIVELSKEVARLKENLKSEKSEVYKWKDLVKELRSLLDGRAQDMDAKREEVNLLRERLRETQSELESTSDRLHRGIEENETLCQRLRELERTAQSAQSAELTQGKVRSGSSSVSICGSREKFCSKRNLPRMDSLSDLTNFDLPCDPEELEKECLVEEYHALRLRLEKAVCEILALKREVRGAESAQDDMELTNQRLKNDLRMQQDDFHAQMSLMSTRVQDLTTKLNNSEKQVRALKQKVNRNESRERRRTLSLKGKESFSLSKDLESKLSQLEARMDSLSKADGQNKCASTLSEARRSKSFEEAARRTRLRRKSLDGQAASQDALDAVVRINALEEKISNHSGKDFKKGSNTSLSSTNAENSSNSLQVCNTKSPLVSPLRSPAAPRKTCSSRTPKISSERLPKLTRSESEPQLLRDRLSTLESVLREVQTKVSESESCVRALRATCSCRTDLLPRLQELLSSTSRLAIRRHEREAVKRVKPLAQLLQELLKERLAQAATRRQELRAAGKWTKEAQTKALAERLAWETLLLTQVAQATQKAQHPKAFEDSLRLQDLAEAHRKISFLEKALTNPEFDMEPMTPLEFNTTLLAEKLVVTGDLLSTLKPSAAEISSVDSNRSSSLNGTCKDLLTKVLQRERSLAGLLTKYKEQKLQEIAALMASDTVQGIMVDDSVLPEELRLREAWGVAQDILMQEVASLEASQSVLRMAHLLGPSDMREEPLSCPQGGIEILQKAAEESLRQEMEESVFVLSAKYEGVLALVREGDASALSSARGKDLAKALSEFASVIAQKALIDGQLAVATGEGVAEVDNPLVVEEGADPGEAAQDVVVSESHLLMFLGGCDTQLDRSTSSYVSQAELAFIFNRISSQETQIAPTIGKMDPPTHPSPKFRRRGSDGVSSTGRRSRRASDVTGMLTGSCKGCEDLQQELNRIHKKVPESKRLNKKETDCRKCSDYLQALKRLKDDHCQAIEALQSQHEAEISRLRDQVKFDPPTRDSDDELTELKRRLCLLEEGYEAQISALKKQYQEALGSQSDVCEENIRQRYQHEIEHLRELCEKGLSAMESSHRRMVSELQAKHRRELELLQTEKEEALAEETQATLAALDAMRKAHQAEVQKEVAKFKEEFLRQENLRQENPGLGEVRREILMLSEKYSAKCLEAAVTEQKVESLTKLLNEARAQGRALEERNRLLKQKMSSHIVNIKNNADMKPEDLKHQFECEVALKDEEISRLNQMLQKSKMEKLGMSKLEGTTPLRAREKL